MVSHTTYRLRRRWLAAGFLASVLPIVVNHLGSRPSVLVDIVAPAPIANVLFLLAAVMLVRRPPADARAAAQFLAAIFVFTVLVWTLRIVGVWFSLGGTNDRDRADLTVALFSIAQMVNASRRPSACCGSRSARWRRRCGAWRTRRAHRPAQPARHRRPLPGGGCARRPATGAPSRCW